MTFPPDPRRSVSTEPTRDFDSAVAASETELVPELLTLFAGDLARYRQVLVSLDDPRQAISGEDFLQPHSLTAMMARFRPQFAQADPRGLASIWANQYFMRLFPPVVSAALLLNRRYPLGIEQLRIVVDDQGLPQAFKLPGPGEQLPPEPGPFGRFEHLLEGNLQPFIQALSAHAGLSPKVLWSNAGNYFEAWLGQLKTRTAQPPLLLDGERLLAASHCPDGSRNRLHAPIRYLQVEHADGQVRPWRQRRLCCVRYLLPEVTLCPNCPRLKQPPAA